MPTNVISKAVLACTLCISTAAFSEDVNQQTDWASLGFEVSPEEQDAVERAMAYGREISKKAEKINGKPYRRDAHAKATGCARATFSINGDIDQSYRYSVFREPAKEYQAWIRFSNGDMTVRPDAKADARGMAVKLMGVEGEKIAQELRGAASQDFIMTNTPAFFNRNIFDYVDDMSYLAKLERTRWFISLWPPRLHPEMLYRATQTVSKKISTPLDAQYYSMLPYQLGNVAYKFSVKPCAGSSFDPVTDKSDPNYLHKALTSHLASDSACFDFMLQAQVPGENMPVDDASVIWSEDISPFVPVAKIHIPPQNFEGQAQEEFCENLSMNPWHGVGQWQPLGSLNRARRLVYHAVSQYRHTQNKAPSVEPESWCLEQGAECKLSEIFNVEKATWPLPKCFDANASFTSEAEVDTCW